MVRFMEENPGKSQARCKWFKVDGRTVQGTWERDLALKMCALGIPWVRARQKGNRMWTYSDQKGIEHRYTPDFYLPNQGIQLEVKGYWWGRDKEKMDRVLSQNPTARIVVIEEELYRTLLVEPSEERFLQTLWEQG